MLLRFRRRAVFSLFIRRTVVFCAFCLVLVGSTGVFLLCVDVADLFWGFGGIEGVVFSLCFFGCVGFLFLFGLESGCCSKGFGA